MQMLLTSILIWNEEAAAAMQYGYEDEEWWGPWQGQEDALQTQDLGRPLLMQGVPTCQTARSDYQRALRQAPSWLGCCPCGPYVADNAACERRLYPLRPKQKLWPGANK